MLPHTRRDFLKTASAATLAALAVRPPRLFAEPPEKIAPRADCIIVLWMAGGMASTETFDPKRYTAYQSGVESKAVLSTFPSIPTAVDGVRFSEGLEKMAAVVDPACGIVKAIMPNWLEQGDARVFAFGAVTSEASPLTLRPNPVYAKPPAVVRPQVPSSH